MYEPNEPEPRPADTPPDARRAAEWLRDGGAVERILQDALGGPPDERDVTLARMGGVLQATAQGLGPAAAAVWAGVPPHVLEEWTDRDPAFATALCAARALAAAHGVRAGEQHTPAMLRVLLVALGNGSTDSEAVRLAGFRPQRFRALHRASAALQALVAAARALRTSRRVGYVPSAYRPRRPGRKPPADRSFRLVRRAAPTGDDASE
ncbi:hypothetical protein [Streptomyces sp. NPDC048659]|uniref:hypothetical protein n=1 Tax=Streptomyces sp. NPDC048659 TaxID=3155489 RepID=UPI003420E54D